MRPQSSGTVSAIGVSNVLVADYRSPFEPTTLAIVLDPSSVLTAKVQITTDDIWAAGYDPSVGNWQDHSTLSGKTAYAIDGQTYPITAARLNVTAWTSGGAHLLMISGGGN